MQMKPIAVAFYGPSSAPILAPSVISRSTKKVMKSAGPKSSSSSYLLILMTSKNLTRPQLNQNICLYRRPQVNSNKYRYLDLAIGFATLTPQITQKQQPSDRCH